ncbi:hypothetical protein [Streptomyces acidiscabies]|uniref:Uncharacterized protein n=1 Tax=Streptomyces acidiscabies TaxID=42234 RepID=A0ABU4M498_9ACTN|nr:hypothetical protein [Streptomyces acidiscabies]MDX3022780.1 hypothetical protein [Streptomyces acidiscabies]
MMGNDAPQVPRSQVIADYRLREGTEEAGPRRLPGSSGLIM